MRTSDHNQHLAETISAINSPHFTSKLMRYISALFHFDCAVIVGYREGKHPIYLYDSIENQRDLLFHHYLTSSFQNDPFYQKLVSDRKQGIFTLREVVRHNLDYQDYCDQFYRQTGWQDEISLLIEVAPERWVVIYLGATRQDNRFSSAKISQLRRYFEVIQSLCQQHWKQSDFTLAHPVSDRHLHATQIRATIEQALASLGKELLTKREQQVAALIAQGSDTKDIALQLKLTEGTVKNHRKRIYSRLNVASLSEFFQLFLNHLILQAK